jgi:hypothetical protein
VYDLQVNNASSGLVVEVSGGTRVGPHSTWDQKDLGSLWMSTSQFGTLNLLDIADAHIPGDSGETWGVLISYQGEEMVGRYEGQGTLWVTFNDYGQAALNGMDIRQVSLPAMTFG